eukprot:scaffold8424_cov120-Isochrysis_galbana.AAC.3
MAGSRQAGGRQTGHRQAVAGRRPQQDSKSGRWRQAASITLRGGDTAAHATLTLGIRAAKYAVCCAGLGGCGSRVEPLPLCAFSPHTCAREGGEGHTHTYSAHAHAAWRRHTANECTRKPRHA